MTIGAYETVRLLGRGGMGEVYEAVNARLGSRHAVKIYAYPQADDSVRQRFVQEGQTLARLCHPRIVRVTDWGETDDGRPYFVMDLVLSPSGKTQTLADLANGSVDEAMIGRWYDDVRDGLAYIHGQGIIHRDLKLQNVMIGPDGHAVLTDFGIAHVAPAKGGDASASADDPVQTVIRMRDGKKPVMGSIGYMAPEVEMGLPATAKSDWYALGVMTYRLLTGTWCDARTDLNATLDTYDPVWIVLLPKLLHANPDGRDCLSYAEESVRASERAALKAEDRYWTEKRRGHVARHVARYVGVLTLLLAIAVGWCVHEMRAQRQNVRLRMQLAGERSAVPSFDELFCIPAKAQNEEQTNENGEVVMPSRAQFEAARVDALVLTEPIFAALSSGSMTVEKAAGEFETLASRLEENSNVSPFDNLNFGGSDYMQFGDNEPLRMLFENAAAKLRDLTES